MTKNPWLKFYPRDWRGDQALRVVSVGARGLWIEMLCIMHEATPYGHLVIGGSAVNNDMLARVSGIGLDEVSALLIELESARVFSRTRKGVIYSRRMIRDASRSEKGRKSVEKRWLEDTENKQEKTNRNRSPTDKPITQKPEARSQSNKYPAQLPTAAGPPPDEPANRLDRLTAACSAALGQSAPADAVIGPMLPLVDAFGERKVLETLASEARRPRRKPIRTWALWAEILREALVAAPPITVAPGDEEITYDHGRKVKAKDLIFHIKRWIEKPETWRTIALGQPPNESPFLQKFAAERGIEINRETAA